MTRRRLIVAGGVVALALAVFVAVWFQPQKLFIDKRVSETLPTMPVPRAESGTTAVTALPRSIDLATGTFVGREHGTKGVARIVRLADGSRIVRLEGLDTSNGPDLYLYLSTNDAHGDNGAFDDEIVNLGRLKGNQGDQNYELTANVDLAHFKSVVIWCDRFNSAFGAADLTTA